MTTNAFWKEDAVNDVLYAVLNMDRLGTLEIDVYLSRLLTLGKYHDKEVNGADDSATKNFEEEPVRPICKAKQGFFDCSFARQRED